MVIVNEGDGPREGEGGTHPGSSENKRPETPAAPELTAEERAGGWDSSSLALYRAERQRAAARRTVGGDELVGGFVVTEFERPPPPGPALEGPGLTSKAYSPHRWRGRR